MFEKHNPIYDGTMDFELPKIINVLRRWFQINSFKT